MNVKINIVDHGSITLELFRDVAPISVDNFIKNIKDGVYNNSSFHRIIRGFMIQGGSSYKEVDSIVGEFKSNGIENNLKHERGVISMARTMIKDSATSQFFICHEDASHLDGEYAAFGKMIDGFDVLDDVANVYTDMSDKPMEDVIIESIEIL